MITTTSILIATNPCKMKGMGNTTLTPGREYPVVSITRENRIEIIDDEGDPHYFLITGKVNYTKYFTIK